MTHRAFALVLLVVLCSLPAAAQSSSLPTGIGWHPLPSTTSLQGSGACPPNNFGGDSYSFSSQCKYVIRAWSGAAADTVNNRLLLFGGGSGNYYGNEIYALDLTAPSLALKRIKDPAVPTNFSTRSTCAEGLPAAAPETAPNSRASYGGLAFIPGPNRLFIVGGSLACSSGNGTQHTWTIPTDGLSNGSPWRHHDPTLLGPKPGSNGGRNFPVIAEHDPRSGRVIVGDGGALYAFDYPSNTYSRLTPPYGFVIGSRLSGVVDAARNLFIAMGDCPKKSCASGSGVYVADLSSPGRQDWTAATMADSVCAEFLAGGATPLNTAGYPGLAYDPVTSTIIGWPNQGDSVYRITPDVANKRMRCEKLIFAGGPPNSAMSGSNTTTGTFDRFRYFPALDAFVLINDWNIPAYLLRLRDVSGPAAPAISVAPSDVTFGNQPVGSSSSAKTITITSSGTAPLTIDSISSDSAEFSFGHTCGTLPATLAAGSSCSVAVTFAPTAAGTRMGALTIAHSAGAPVSVNLSGTGTVVTLNSITVAPVDASVLVNATVQFTATGHYSDGSTLDLTSAAQWTSSNTQVVTISSSAVATAKATGTTTISATYGGVTGSTTLTVNTSLLPTGIGWHALPSTTSLQGSGACPPNYFGGDAYAFSSYCKNVIRAWNGAVADTKNNRLLIFGGGHDNYYGNEIYALDLNATPPTLKRLKDPTVPTNFLTKQTCVEGLPASAPQTAPNSRETYSGLAYMANVERMFVFGGSLACGPGNGGNGTWSIATSNLTHTTPWTFHDLGLIGPKPGAHTGGGTYGVVADYDPNTGLVFLSDSGALFTFNYATNTYRKITPDYGFWTSIYMNGVVDPARRLFVALGHCDNAVCTNNNGVRVADISNPEATIGQNWTGATLSDPECAEFLAGGANPLYPLNGAYPGLAFDPVTNKIVGWPNQGNTVYLITPDKVNKKLTCEKVTYPGGPPNSAHYNGMNNSTTGTFGRFRYFPAVDAFVVVNDWNIPAYILRLR